MSRPQQSERGFSLVEILASLTITAVLLMGIITFFTDGYRSLNQDGTKIHAVSEAQRALEATRSWMIDQYAAGTLLKNGQIVIPEAALQSYGFRSSPGLQTTISLTYNTSAHGWYILVTTQWSYRGETRRYNLTSFFGDYDHAKGPISP